MTEDRKFMYYGWLPILELDAPLDDEVLRAYTWGLDLSGSLDGLAGVGGLLAMLAPGAGPGASDLNAVYTYDTNGNVGQLVAWATGFGGAQGDEWHLDRLLAHYEYDPYGGVTAQSGTYAAANPVRFSTKYWDDETGLGYWGYRYYSPALGRWISRDPMEEDGSSNLYAYVLNHAVSAVDPDGRFIWGCSAKPQEPSMPRRTDDECCRDAKAVGIDQGHAGGVICCDGKKVACAWRNHYGDPSRDAAVNVAIECGTQHELTHFDDTPECPSRVPSLSRPPWKPGVDQKQAECVAYTAQLKCLKGKNKACENVPNPRECQDFLNVELRRVETQVRRQCAK